MKRWLSLAVTCAVIVAAAAGAAGCGDDDDGDGGATPTTGATEPSATEPSETPGAESTVSARLSEYTIVPDPASVPAGSVTFDADNVGGTEHELVVIKTDLAPEDLPMADDGSADEGGAGVEVIGEIEEFEAQTTESATFELDAGAYVLLCNVVQDDGTSHYAEGMHAAFTVE